MGLCGSKPEANEGPKRAASRGAASTTGADSTADAAPISGASAHSGHERSKVVGAAADGPSNFQDEFNSTYLARSDTSLSARDRERERERERERNRRGCGGGGGGTAEAASAAAAAAAAASAALAALLGGSGPSTNGRPSAPPAPPPPPGGSSSQSSRKAVGAGGPLAQPPGGGAVGVVSNRDMPSQTDPALLAALVWGMAGPTVPVRWRKGPTIGSGSYGTVYLGLNSDTGELLAVKEVSAVAPSDGAPPTGRAGGGAGGNAGGGVPEAVHQLEREVALLSGLRHPNIVRYVGTQREPHALYIFLEYVPGGSVSSLLSRFGPLDEPLVALFARQLLLGLAYLHAQRTVHRDIKGANLLLEKNGVLKLADFGMAKQMIEQVSFTRSFKGSAFWMAPEVIKQQGHGVAADIWSVGCTVLEMATGRPPWSQCTSQVQAIFKIASSNDLPAIPDSLSPLASEFLLLCLQRDPAARPSAEELLKHPFIASAAQPQGGKGAAVPPSLMDPLQQLQLGGAGVGLDAVGIPAMAGRLGSVTVGTPQAGAGLGASVFAGGASPLAGGRGSSISYHPPTVLHLGPPAGALVPTHIGKAGSNAMLGQQPGMAAHGSAGLPYGAGPAAATVGQMDEDQLATMVLGDTMHIAKQPRGVQGAGPGTVAREDDEDLTIDFTTQPQQFRVRGLVSLPPLKLLQGGQQLPAVAFMPLRPGTQGSQQR